MEFLTLPHMNSNRPENVKKLCSRKILNHCLFIRTSICIRPASERYWKKVESASDSTTCWQRCNFLKQFQEFLQMLFWDALDQKLEIYNCTEPKFWAKNFADLYKLRFASLGKKLRATMKNCESLEQFRVILSETFLVSIEPPPPPKKKKREQTEFLNFRWYVVSKWPSG